MIYLITQASRSEIKRDNALISDIIREHTENDPTCSEMVLEDVDDSTLEMVLFYMEKCKGVDIEVPATTIRDKATFQQLCPDWLTLWLNRIWNRSKEDFYKLMILSEKLQINGLKRASCAMLANLCSMQKSQDIKALLGLQ